MKVVSHGGEKLSKGSVTQSELSFFYLPGYDTEKKRRQGRFAFDAVAFENSPKRVAVEFRH